MQDRIQKIINGTVPAVIAVICVRNENSLTAWVGTRASVLPLAVIVLLFSVFSKRLRHLLIITLCFGVAFMAIRDIGRVGSQPLPQALNFDFLDQSRPAILLLIAALSATAAFMETLAPGTVLARRCYFAAAALYFMGLGIIHVGKYGSWKAILLCVTGVTAIFGSIFADRIVSSEMEAEAEEEADEVSDAEMQMQREEAHRKTLLAKEWHETPAKEPAAKETLSSGTEINPLLQ